MNLNFALFVIGKLLLASEKVNSIYPKPKFIIYQQKKNAKCCKYTFTFHICPHLPAAERNHNFLFI